MMRDQLLLDGHGLIKQLFKESAIRKSPLFRFCEKVEWSRGSLSKSNPTNHRRAMFPVSLRTKLMWQKSMVRSRLCPSLAWPS